MHYKLETVSFDSPMCKMSTLGSSNVGFKQYAQSWDNILGDPHHCYRCYDFPNALADYATPSYISHTLRP